MLSCGDILFRRARCSADKKRSVTMNFLTSSFFWGGRGAGAGLMFDWTYLLALAGLALTLIASANVKRTFSEYSKVRSATGLDGMHAAEKVLHSFGIYNVAIEHVAGSLTDHYDPRSKTLRLSDSTYRSPSVAAICVAAHECGHASQDQERYAPLVLRSTLVPAANIGSSFAWPIFIAGLFFSIRILTTAGIVLFSLAVLFQLVTLPVEFNASSRALRALEENHILPENELTGGRKVLKAAALTYVAALASSMLQLLRLILLSQRRSD